MQNLSFVLIFSPISDDNLSIMADIGVVELLLNAMKNHIQVHLLQIRSTELSYMPREFNQPK